jgi:hypothetical protein
MHLPPPHRRAGRRTAALALAAALAAGPAAALELSWSGFGTLGLAVSPDAPGRYLRFIDDRPSLQADSVAALQLDARFSPTWSATVQLKAAASDRSDQGLRLTPAWAFLAWRPNDEWLLRAGKMRVPVYLHSESLDIGVAHDMARLPVEMYSLAPTNDYTGLNVAYSRGSDWLAGGDFTLEAMWGRSAQKTRLWFRDGLPPAVPAGAAFSELDTEVASLVATLRNSQTTLRLSAHEVRVSVPDGSPIAVRYPFVSIAPGLGYYRVNEALPGPPIPTVGAIRNLITTAGIEQRLGGGWRVTAEIASNQQRRTDFGADTLGGYVAVFKELDRFTPYLSLGRIDTDPARLQRRRELLATQLPAGVPGAEAINAAMRVAAETIYVAEQQTLAIGSSWRTPWGGKLKAEYAHTKIGEVTRLIDTPQGQPVPQEQRFGTWTFSYSLAF